MSMPQRYDYKREWENFQNAKSHDKTITQKAYAEARGLSEFIISTRFAEHNRAAEDDEIRQTLRRIARTGNNKVAEFIETYQPAKIDDAATLAKIGMGAADRIGFSPQAAQISLTQQNINQIQIAPLFEGDQGEDIKRLIGG